MDPRNHPTGIAGSLTALVLLVLRQAGVEIDADTGIAIGGVVTLVVSLLSPRVTHITSIMLTPEKGDEE